MKKVSTALLIIISFIAYSNASDTAGFMSGQVVPEYVLATANFSSTNNFEQGELVAIPRWSIDLNQTVNGYIFAEYIEQIEPNLSQVSITESGTNQSFQWMIHTNEIGKINLAAHDVTMEDFNRMNIDSARSMDDIDE